MVSRIGAAELAGVVPALAAIDDPELVAELAGPELVGDVLERSAPHLDTPIPFGLSELDRPIPYALTEKALEALGLVSPSLEVGDEFRRTRARRKRKAGA